MKTSEKMIISAFCAFLSLLITACSSDDAMDGGKTDVQIDAVRNIEFRLKFDDYNTEDTINHATRSVQDAELSKPHIVPMGNMMYAEVSLQRDTTKKTSKGKAITRAITDGTYTLYAYQGSTLKGTLTGTVVSNVFTPTSSNNSIYLTPGTYTFVCCNDKVQISGETWTIARADVETARIGIATGKVISATPRKQKVALEMKHVGCRARVELKAEGFPILNATSTLTSTSNIVGSVKFNTASQTYASVSTEAFSAVPDFSTYASSYSDDWYSGYMYFLPGTAGGQLKLTLTGGTAYRLPVAGRTVSFPALTSMAANGSYTLRLVLHYNYIYLYSDGTTGQYTDPAHSGKTPIGIVVSRSKRLAVALKNASLEAVRQSPPSSASSTLWSAASLQHTQSLTTMSSNVADHLSDFKGENYTWTSTYSTDGKVKGNKATDYPAFYAAAHYNPGVTVTGANVGRWFLPTLGEWNLLSKNLDLEITDLPLSTTLYPVRPGVLPSGYSPVSYGFRRAGGIDLESFASSSGETQVTIPLLSSEYDANNYISPLGYARRETWGMMTSYMTAAYLIKKGNPLSNWTYGTDKTEYIVRPFVHY